MSGRPRIVIAGTHSGVGKTTAAVGLMAALRQQGYVVQGFKAGPDFIDPGFHTAVTGRASRNVDGWMLGLEGAVEVFGRGSRGADVSVIEGVMGLYDGKEPGRLTGSTAEIAVLLQAPVILVVDVEGMAGSAAAVVLGFQQMEPDVNIAGVLVNRAGSAGHYQLVKQAVEERCGIPVIGYLERHAEIRIPERHLGLVPSVELDGQGGVFGGLAKLISETVDLEQVMRIARGAPELPSADVTRLFRKVADAAHSARGPVTIAVAKDEAFHFYYPENLELLEQFGARLVYFRPLDGECVPAEADGLYIGGGFPEEFAERLSGHTQMLDELRRRITGGLPTYAECGGYMLLAETMTDRNGRTFKMAGVVPADVSMQTRLAALGYREVTCLQDGPVLAAGETARGHEFHYSTMEYRLTRQKAWRYANRGVEREDGFSLPNLTAGYIHLHFCSNPRTAERFVEACRRYHSERCD